MLRAIDDVDGQGIYIRKLMQAVLERDSANIYILFYQSKSQAGRYASFKNVQEIVLPAINKLVWDQFTVPLAARREHLDVLFHHKFSIPLFCSCPTVVQQRGTEYWMHPEYFKSINGQIDLWYNRIMIPLACKTAAKVLTNSNSLADELAKYIGLSHSKMTTIYAAADPSFQEVTDPERLKEVRIRYGLPAKNYLLMAVKGHQIANDGSSTLAPRKNVEISLMAYGQLQRHDPQALPIVILGLAVSDRLTPELLSKIPYPERIVTPGLAAFEDMPAIYSMAAALVFPSRYESFGIPIVEAMACGCPVITSDVTACPEVAGDAGILVDPDDSAAIARAMQKIGSDIALREELRAKGIARAARFSWDESARLLISELRQAAR